MLGLHEGEALTGDSLLGLCTVAEALPTVQVLLAKRHLTMCEYNHAGHFTTRIWTSPSRRSTLTPTSCS